MDKVYKLDPKVKEQWVAALRSGEYKQCKARLTDGKGNYCCLGVLCEVMGAEKEMDGENSDFIVTTYYGQHPTFGRHGSTGILPMGLVPGFPTDGLLNQVIPDPEGKTMHGFYGSLWELNDKGGYTFDQIADIIEEQF